MITLAPDVRAALNARPDFTALQSFIDAPTVIPTWEHCFGSAGGWIAVRVELTPWTSVAWLMGRFTWS